MKVFPINELLRSQKNYILQELKIKNFDVSQFIWDSYFNSQYKVYVPQLIHIPTNYYFIFDNAQTSKYYHYEYSPAFDSVVDESIKPSDGIV